MPARRAGFARAVRTEFDVRKRRLQVMHYNDLLTQLARKPWQVFTSDVLLRDVWGYRHSADTRLVNVHVQRLRSKVEHDPENPEIVQTVRGVGYKAGGTPVATR